MSRPQAELIFHVALRRRDLPGNAIFIKARRVRAYSIPGERVEVNADYHGPVVLGAFRCESIGVEWRGPIGGEISVATCMMRQFSAIFSLLPWKLEAVRKDIERDCFIFVRSSASKVNL